MVLTLFIVTYWSNKDLSWFLAFASRVDMTPEQMTLGKTWLFTMSTLKSDNYTVTEFFLWDSFCV